MSAFPSLAITLLLTLSSLFPLLVTFSFLCALLPRFPFSLLSSAVTFSFVYAFQSHCIPLPQAIEVFTGTCLAFIFVAAVESVVVDVLGHFPTKGRQPLSPTRNSFALEVSGQKVGHERLCSCKSDGNTNSSPFYINLFNTSVFL